MDKKIAELIRKFNPNKTNGCYYCGSYFNFSDEMDDVELLVKEIITLIEANNAD